MLRYAGKVDMYAEECRNLVCIGIWKKCLNRCIGMRERYTRKHRCAVNSKKNFFKKVCRIGTPLCIDVQSVSYLLDM